MQNQNVKPRYEVHKLDETVTVTKYRRTDEGINEQYTEEEDGGYMVYFPAGHSIRVRTDADLRKLGLDAPAALIDMESGDEVGTTERLSLKKHVQRRSGASKRADSGAIEANQGA